MIRLGIRLVILVGLSAWPHASSGSDKFQRFDFSLRFPAALSRIATYGDTAGVGGASAGSRFQSSVNPASAAWSLEPDGTFRTSVSPQATYIAFDRGQRFRVGVATLGLGTEAYGDLQLSLAKARTNRRVNASGMPFYFKTDLLQVQWGRMFGDATSVGIAYAFSESFTELGDQRSSSVATRSKAHAFRGGLLRRMSADLLAGLVLEHSTSPGRTSFFDAGSGGSFDLGRDRTRLSSARAGLTWEYLPESSLYLDVQKIVIANDSGRLRASRLYGGVEQRLFEGVFGRLGATVDMRGPWSFTTGLGIYPTKTVSVDFAYQRNMFPELGPDFGRSHLFTLSASASF